MTELTTGNIGNNKIRTDSVWFMDHFYCLIRAFRCSTYHSRQPQAILKDIIVLLKVSVYKGVIFWPYSQKWSVLERLVKRVCCASEWPLGQSAGRKNMWKHVVVSALFGPPLEVRPSSTLSWTSVTRRCLDGLDEVYLKLILLLFPFKMHFKSNKAPWIVP